MSLTARLLLTALPLLAAVSSTPALAVEDGQRFKDWMVSCPQAPEGEMTRCFIFQNLAIKENNQPVLSVRVGYVRGPEQPAAVLTVPLGVFLPVGMEIKVDEGEPTRLAYQVCNQGGCLAAMPLTDGRLELFKAGSRATVSFQDGRRQPVSVPVSLSGFTAGFEALR